MSGGLIIQSDRQYRAAIEQISATVATLDTVPHAASVAAMASALEKYARRSKLGAAEVNRAVRVKLDAERRAGVLLRQDSSIGSGKGRGTQPLAKLGVTRHESHRWQKLAAIPDAEFEEIVANATRTGIVSTAAIVQEAKRRRREAAINERRRQTEETARQRLADSTEPLYQLHEGSLADWRPTEVEAIITDPPYAARSLHVYEELRDFAVEVLPDGAPLVVMISQMILPEVIHALQHPRLVWRWQIAWRFDTHNPTPIFRRHAYQKHKPILIYSAGALPEDADWFRDEIDSPAARENDHHRHGQAVEGFETLIRWFSRPGQVVADPFVGGGTTAVAAIANGRRFTGCDIDPKAIAITRKRLEGVDDDKHKASS